VSGAPFMVALVDDPSEGDVKLVVMFKEPGHTAVLSFDKLVQNCLWGCVCFTIVHGKELQCLQCTPKLK
jgi:hypothetical protein